MVEVAPDNELSFGHVVDSSVDLALDAPSKSFVFQLAFDGNKFARFLLLNFFLFIASLHLLLVVIFFLLLFYKLFLGQ